MKGLLWIPACVGIALVCAAIDEGSGIRKSVRLRADLREADARIATLRSEVDALRREAEALEAGGFAEERAIREELGLAAAGETLVRGLRSGSASDRIY